MLVAPESTALAQISLKFCRSIRSLNLRRLQFNISQTSSFSPHPHVTPNDFFSCFLFSSSFPSRNLGVFLISSSPSLSHPIHDQVLSYFQLRNFYSQAFLKYHYSHELKSRLREQKKTKLKCHEFKMKIVLVRKTLLLILSSGTESLKE